MADASETHPAEASVWRVLSIPAIVVVGLLNYLDRALPAVLAESIKNDLVLSDTALGLINGFGFLLVYALAGVPIARVADLGRQAAVISVSLGVWSLMTLAGCAVANAWQLAVTRMGVALGEPAACLHPTLTLPSDIRRNAARSRYRCSALLCRSETRLDWLQAACWGASSGGVEPLS